MSRKALTRSIGIGLTILLLLLSLIFTVTTVGVTLAEEVGVSVAEVAAVESYVNAMETAYTLPNGVRNFALGQEKKANKEILLRDFNEEKAYLYVEFDLGGYAIYDREGSFVYERTMTGEGPYHGLTARKKLYYGGPQQYFYQDRSELVNCVTGQRLPKKYLKGMTARLAEVREENMQRNAETAATGTNSAAAVAADQVTYHYLGETLPAIISENTMWYFPVLAIYHSQNYNPKAIFIRIQYENQWDDVTWAYNRYGSCSIVALASAMMYYDRLEYGWMVPGDLSKFHLMYNLEFNYVDPEGNLIFDQKLNSTDREQFVVEFLHQELLYQIFPELRGKQSTYTSSTFGIQLDKMKTGVSNYFRTYGLVDVPLISRKKNNGMDKEILRGNPVMMSFEGAYRAEDNSTGDGVNHSVVAYAYTAEKGFWGEKTLEYVVNFGWPRQFYGSVYINSALPYTNMNFEQSGVYA